MTRASSKVDKIGTAKLREREERMIQACEVANNNAEVLAVEQDWDAMLDKTDRIKEPWIICPGAVIQLTPGQPTTSRARSVRWLRRGCSHRPDSRRF